MSYFNQTSTDWRLSQCCQFHDKKLAKQFNFGTILIGFIAAFNIHRGIIPTLRDLLISPVLVMNEYIEGKIDKYGYNKYFSPGRFFVTVLAILSVFAFFAPDTDLSDNLINVASLAYLK